MREIASMGVDRRRAPRVDLLASLHGHLVTLDERVEVKQLSAGGMTIETTTPLSTRLAHDFRFTLDNATFAVRARVVHGRVIVAGDTVTHLTGLEFVDLSQDAIGALGAVLDGVDAVA